MDINTKQLQKVKNILTHAKNNVPYYRNILRNINVERLLDLKDIPILTKRNLRESYKDLLTEDVEEGQLHFEFTSGSTGIPIKYPRSKKDRLLNSLSLIQERSKWLGKKPSPRKVAVFSARIKENYSSDNHKHWLELSLENLTDENLDKQIFAILDYKPEFIQGPSQVLTRLAKRILEQKFDMSNANIILIENRSEYLSSIQRLLIEKAFKTKVSNMYGTHESWGIAYSCENHQLHIMGDNVFVEILNDAGEVIESGEEGEVVITSLNCYSLPLIRYSIGDRASISYEKCSCGNNNPILNLSQYRHTNWILTPGGNKSPILLRNFVNQLTKSEFNHVLQFQIIQNSIDYYEVRVLTSAEPTFELTDFIISEVKKNFDYEVNVEVSFNIPFIQNKNSGKVSWFVSNIEKKQKSMLT